MVLREKALVNMTASANEQLLPWGRYESKQRFNADTTGLNVFTAHARTYTKPEERALWNITKVGDPDNSQRFASMHLCLCTSKEAPMLRPRVLFKGNGGNGPKDKRFWQESMKYHVNVHPASSAMVGWILRVCWTG